MKEAFFRITYFFKTHPVIFLLTTILSCFGVVKLLFFIFPIKELEPDNTWIETVGTMTRYALGRNGKGYMRYKVETVSYEEMNNMNSYGRVLGEKYVILVNPKNHHEYITKIWEPVFLSNDATAMCIGEITRVYAFNWGATDSFITNHGIEYSYIVNGCKYERAQDLPPEYTGIYNRLKKRNILNVEYLIANPQHSIMYFSPWFP